MAYYPSYPEVLQQPDKSCLFSVKRSLRSIIPNIFYFLIALLVVGILEYYFYDLQMPDLPLVRHLSIRWLGIIPFVFLMEVLRRYHNDLYTFSEHRLTHQGGRLSLSYSVPLINYVDIRAITVQQDIFARILDYGNLLIGTAAVDGNELVMHGVRSPVELAALIDDLRSNSKNKRVQEAKSEGGEAPIEISVE